MILVTSGSYLRNGTETVASKVVLSTHCLCKQAVPKPLLPKQYLKSLLRYQSTSAAFDISRKYCFFTALLEAASTSTASTCTLFGTAPFRGALSS